ncbi:MAG TPA: hypothetical protein VF219_01175, partial [Vicinamibacterales bacterium]
MTDPRAEYDRRLDGWRARSVALDRSHLRISNVRLLTAGAAAVACWLAFARDLISPLWIVAIAGFFVALMVVH